MLTEIASLHETLINRNEFMTQADKVAIRNEIGDLQDRVALLDFTDEGEDIDFGHHSEWEWPKSLALSKLRRGPCRRLATYPPSTTYNICAYNINRRICQVFY
mgnify:CR=1 FL=1